MARAGVKPAPTVLSTLCRGGFYTLLQNRRERETLDAGILHEAHMGSFQSELAAPDELPDHEECVDLGQR